VSVLVVPAIETKNRWPTLGDQVGTWIEQHLCFGPGDLRGAPAKLDAEKRALIYRMYELYPQCLCGKKGKALEKCMGHKMEGRRRYRRAALSLRKGSAKSEFAAWLAAAELHPRAPVRFAGWDRKGRPKPGKGVIDPYIPLVAYTEEQSEDLVYGALLAILELSPSVRGDFDIGLGRIMRIGGDGKAVALAAAPDARDGARTTFQVFDETHRFTLAKLKQAHRTMLANLPKRKLADPWSLETTTAPAPGEGSVAEDAMEYATAIAEGRATDASFFFFHRQATEGAHDLQTPAGVRAAVLDASGPVADWSDIEGIVDQWKDPTADKAYLARVWLNQPVRAADRAFDFTRWSELARLKYIPEDGALITIGFDGSKYDDSTVMIGTEVETGFQFVLGFWEKPFGAAGQGWEVPEAEVNDALAAAMERWDVWRVYADPPYWESIVAHWSGEYGEERITKWPTNRWVKMAASLLAYRNAQISGELSHDGDPRFARHIGNAFRRTIAERSDTGEQLWVVYKERKDSPNKIDGAVAGDLSWQARTDAIEEGVRSGSKYERGDLIVMGGAAARAHAEALAEDRRRGADA
jgi:hypothetical protein